MTLERKIIDYGPSSDGTEIDRMVEAVCLRESAKNWAWMLAALAAVLFPVICGASLKILGVNTPWSVTIWAIIGLCGVVGATVTWLFCWPFDGRFEYCREALDLIKAIRFVESVTGKPFENWSLLDNSVEEAVEEALHLELVPIFALQERDPKRASDLFAKWRRRHEQMQRLFPSIKGYHELTTPVTFLPYDPGIAQDESVPAKTT